MECIIEYYVFLPSYDLVPPSPAPSISELDGRHTGRLRMRDNLLTGEGGGEGEAKPYDGKKASYSILQ